MDQVVTSTVNGNPDEVAIASETSDAQPVQPQTKESKQAYQFLASRPIVVESESELNTVLEKHQHWIASVLNPRAEVMEGRANISGSNISGFDLAGMDLRGVNFSRCILQGTNLQNCNLNGANFNHSNLQGADLRGASIKRTIFDYADLRDAEIENLDFAVASTAHALMHSEAPAAEAKVTAAEQQVAEEVREDAEMDETHELTLGQTSHFDESSSLNASAGSSSLVDFKDSEPDSII